MEKIKHDKIHRAIERLPYYRVSANFNEKVLAALGYEAKPLFSASWLRWAVPPTLALVSCWMAILGFLLLPKWPFLLDPFQAVSFIKLFIAKLTLSLVNVWSFMHFFEISFIPHFAVSAWLLRFVVSFFMAISLMALIVPFKTGGLYDVKN